jgi:hypothetical protein
MFRKLTIRLWQGPETEQLIYYTNPLANPVLELNTRHIAMMQIFASLSFRTYDHMTHVIMIPNLFFWCPADLVLCY